MIRYFTLDFTFEDSLKALAISAVAYTLLAFYLEQVIPNEYGTNKHPLFFIKWICKSSEPRNDNRQSLLEELSEEENNFQFQDRNDRPIIKLNQVSKQFG